MKKGSKKVKEEKLHKNVRCRECFAVDGYFDGDEVCRHCGAKLFEADII